jgi:hypothetical protein
VTSTWADAKVFAQGAGSPVVTANQKIFLHFAGGIERLVIETSFLGEGTNFGWIIPLPAVPTIEPVSSQFFEALDSGFQPAIRFKGSKRWIWFLSLGLLAGYFRWQYRLEGWQGCLSSAIALGVFGWFVVSILASTARSRDRLPEAAIPKREGSVSILQRQTAGTYETAILSGQDGEDMLRWLNDRGFYTPSNALPRIKNYAKKGVGLCRCRSEEAVGKVRGDSCSPAGVYVFEQGGCSAIGVGGS